MGEVQIVPELYPTYIKAYISSATGLIILENLRVKTEEIYRRAIKPVLIYGAEVQDERRSDSRIKTHLVAVQIPFLVCISK